MLALGSQMGSDSISGAAGAIPLIPAARFGSPRDPGRPAPLCLANRDERKLP
jgi:hypothetical protein